MEVDPLPVGSRDKYNSSGYLDSILIVRDPNPEDPVKLCPDSQPTETVR